MYRFRVEKVKKIIEEHKVEIQNSKKIVEEHREEINNAKKYITKHRKEIEDAKKRNENYEISKFSNRMRKNKEIENSDEDEEIEKEKRKVLLLKKEIKKGDVSLQLKTFSFRGVAMFVFKERFRPIAKYEVVDKLTLKLTLSTPFAPFVGNVAEASTLMVSRDIAEASGDQAISSDFSKAIGTHGPELMNSTSPS